MIMFTDVKEVDEHVQRIMSISKNHDDNEMQCYTFANLYFQVKEYSTAKSFIERYMKHKSNSETGYLLKAKIHEQLREHDAELQCYERLYNICKRNTTLTKVSECLLKCSVDNKKAKQWIDTLESEMPNSSLLSPLKIKYSSALIATPEELEKLKEKLGNDKNNQVKRQYLSMLERLHTSENPLSKCVEVLSNYDVLEDNAIVRSSLKIFKLYSSTSDSLISKHLHCLLLISMVKSQAVSCDYDTSVHLADLITLLKDLNESSTNSQLKMHCLYWLISCTHTSELRAHRLTESIASSLQSGYATVACAPDNGPDRQGPPWSWLARQSSIVRSASLHLAGEAAPNVAWVQAVETALWPSGAPCDIKSLLAGPSAKRSTANMAQMDLRCHSRDIIDLDVLLWQLSCLLGPRGEADEVPLTLGAVSLVTGVASLYPGQPIVRPHARCPENLCRIDLVAVVLAAATGSLSSMQGQVGSLPPPPHLVTRPPTSPHQWWAAAQDFLGNNRRNTSVGPLRDLLRRGCEGVQTGVGLPETVVLVMARGLARAADLMADTYWHVPLLERAAVLLASVVRPPPQSATQLKPLAMFEALNVPRATLDRWRVEASLVVVDNGLKAYESGGQEAAEVSLYDLQDLLDSAENLSNGKGDVGLHFLRSRLHLARAKRARDEGETPARWEHFLTCAKESARLCQNSVDAMAAGIDKDQFRDLLHEHTAAIETIENDCARELIKDCNSNFSEAIRPCSYEPAKSVDEPITRDIQYLPAPEVNLQVSNCLEKLETVTNVCQSSQHEIRLLQTNNEHQSSVYSALVAKVDDLVRKMSKMSAVEDEYERLKHENALMKQDMRHLESTIEELHRKNSDLESSVVRCEESIRFYSTLKPQLTNLSRGIDRKLNGVQELVREHLNDHVDTVILSTHIRTNKFTTKVAKSKNTVAKETLPTKEVASNRVDLSHLNKDKWQCQTCMSHNDDNLSKCLACTTAKPGAVAKEAVQSKPIAKNNGFDLSHLTKNKWQCDTCMSHNEDSLSQCLACSSMKPGVAKTTVPLTATKAGESIKFGSTSLQPTETIKFGSAPIQNKEAIKFGSVSNQSEPIKFGGASNQSTEATKPIVFGAPIASFTFGSSQKKPETETKTETKKEIETETKADTKKETKKETETKEAGKWRCECTTDNEAPSVSCVACGEARVDDDVIFVSELFVTEEQRSRARALCLPDHFYHYENVPGYKPDDDEDDEYEVKKPVAKVAQDDGEEDPEAFDPHYQPIVSLETVAVVTGDEDWTETFSRRCKLFRFTNGSWVERGVGDLRVVTREGAGRLLMRRDQVHRVCLNHLIGPLCPSFTAMGASVTAACWFANDFSEGGLEPVKEQFAAKFKTEEDLKQFKKAVAAVQAALPVV